MYRYTRKAEYAFVIRLLFYISFIIFIIFVSFLSFHLALQIALQPVMTRVLWTVWIIKGNDVMQVMSPAC